MLAQCHATRVYSGLQVTGKIEWGQKSKPKKNPWTKMYPPLPPPPPVKSPCRIFRAIKISRGTTRPGCSGTITNLQIVWNTIKKSVLRSSLSLEIRSIPRLGFWPRYNVVSCKLNVALVTVIQCSGNSTGGVTRCRYRREITIAVCDE